MIKLVTVAIWSNFSAHKPAITPIQPSIMDEIKVKKIVARDVNWATQVFAGTSVPASALNSI